MPDNSAEEQPVSERLRLALALGGMGYRIFPLKPNSKEPATSHGFKDATCDLAQITKWWSGGDFNIGLATGLQANGMWVGVVDVDAKHGGVLAWKALTRDNGGSWQRDTPIHKTPCDGFHIFGQADASLGLSSANGLPDGIDTRGDGGYVVLPDSVFVDPETGVAGSYRCSPNHLWSQHPVWFPQWLIDLWQLRPQPVRAPSQARHPSSQPAAEGESPADWCRRNMSLQALMEGEGWVEAGVDGQGRVSMTRPGKSAGISANIQPTGENVYVFTTEIPDYARPFGRVGQDGLPNNFSAWDFLCGFVFRGDTRAAAKAVFAKMPPPVQAAASRTVPAEAPQSTSAVDSLCLPEWFWLQRPWLGHLRDAAWSVGSVPEALLASALGRITTMTSPKWVIPPIVHGKATLDLITVIVGHSGSGKSAPMRRAAEVLPCALTDRRFDFGMGSGEGLLEAYYGMVDEVGADGKTRKVRKKAITGIHFTVDEGAIFVGLTGRNGFTGIDRLLTAWSGGTLSTPNASAEKFRHIPAGEYRFAMTMAIQADLATSLWGGTNTAQGFTGRLTFLSGLSTTVPLPGERPDDPGELRLALPMDHGPHVLRYPPEFVHDIQIADHARQQQIEDPDPLGAHRNLQRVKLAGIMAVADGRFDVDEVDIALGTAIVETSETLRRWLEARSMTAAQRARDEGNRRQGSDLADREAAALDRAAARVARNLIVAVKNVTDPAGIQRYALRKTIAQRDRRPYFDVALDKLLADGLVVEADGYIRLK